MGDDSDKFAEDLTVLTLFGLMDPLKDGVSQSIKKVRRAGLNVIMVTGDNLDTAKAIARKAGIIQKNVNNPSDIEAEDDFVSRDSNSDAEAGMKSIN